jgi:hypothetical protein
MLGANSGTQIVFSGPENAIWVELGALWGEIGLRLAIALAHRAPRSLFQGLKMRSGWICDLRAIGI